jgi:hypothetical protein
MKRITRVVVAAAIAVVPFVAGNSAFAAGTCEIGYTGPNSNNECTLSSTFTCSIKNNNDFDIKNENGQVVGSGTATSSGNTSGGSATTGSATNSNGTSINVSIDNGSSGKLCTVVKTIPATPTPTPTPSTPPAPQPVTPSGGKGSVAPVVKQAVQAPAKAAPTVLPNTSGDEAATTLITVTGLLAAGTVATRLTVAAYGRIKS